MRLHITLSESNTAAADKSAVWDTQINILVLKHCMSVCARFKHSA